MKRKRRRMMKKIMNRSNSLLYLLILALITIGVVSASKWEAEIIVGRFLRGGRQQQQRQPEPQSLQQQQQQQRQLGNNNDDDIIPIHHFTTNLLSTSFPYPMKYNSNQQLSSATSTYLSKYLSSSNGMKVMNLGLDCTKFKYNYVSGSEVYVLSCEGKVIFSTNNNVDEKEVNDAVRNAFKDEAKKEYLQLLYPEYEIVHEKHEYDLMQQQKKSLKMTRGGSVSVGSGGGGSGGGVVSAMTSFSSVSKRRRKRSNNSGSNDKKKGRNNKTGGAAKKKKKKKTTATKKKKKKPTKKKNNSMVKHSSKIQTGRTDIHNIYNSGKNAFGYASGNANSGSKKKKNNPHLNGNGDIIVKVGGG